MKTLKLILLLFFLGIFCNTNSQEKQRDLQTLDIKLPSIVKIIGTSTLHDWESDVEKTDAALTFTDNTKTKIETLNVVVDVYSIKSGKKTMDRLTYKALKAEEYPTINFVFKNGKVITQDENFLNLELNGDLTIAGVTKNVNVITKVNKKGNDVYLTGKHKLKMTTYGITPPKALLGTIKTGDEITINFSLKF